MKLSYHNMEIDISVERLLEIESLDGMRLLNRRGTVKIRFLANEDRMGDILFRPEGAVEITINENQINIRTGSRALR